MRLLKDLGLAVGLAGVMAIPFLAIAGITIGGFMLLKKSKEKKDEES